MKSLVLAADAQSGAVLGVKVPGRPAKACGCRPLTVETQVRGEAYGPNYGLGWEPAYGVEGVYRLTKYRCSVACLEVGWRG